MVYEQRHDGLWTEPWMVYEQRHDSQRTVLWWSVKSKEGVHYRSYLHSIVQGPGIVIGRGFEQRHDGLTEVAAQVCFQVADDVLNKVTGTETDDHAMKQSHTHKLLKNTFI